MLLDLYLDVSIMDLMTDIFLKLIFAMMVPLDFLNIIVLDYSLLFHLDGVYRKKTSLKLILLITLS